MNITKDQIQNAINAAEGVSSPIAPAQQPVTLANEIVLALIAGATRYLQGADEE